MTRYTTTVHATPIGDVLLAMAGDRLLTARVLHGDGAGAHEDLVRRLGIVPETDPAAADEVTRQLDEYFAGSRREFDLELDWRFVRGFTRTALEAVQGIPYGETAGYGEVAAMAGSPRAARAVGTACATTPFSIIVPVHRVVRADGSPGGYGGHPEVKRFLLDLEQAPGA